MKGSIGSGSTIGISTRSVGMRASGTALGVKTLGGSFSPEARLGGNTSAFSSRGLSMFNREAISRPSDSIVNPSFGKSAKSPHARTPGLTSPRGMFDTFRPVRSNPISKPAELGVKLNTKNGLERTSKSARSVNLAPKSIFDIKRPVHNFRAENRTSKPFQVSFEFRKSIAPAKAEQVKVTRISEKPVGRIDAFKYFPDRNRTVAKRTLEAGLNPRIRGERVKSVSSFKDTIILWQRSDVSSRMRPDTARKTAPALERNTQKIVEQFSKISLNKEAMSTHKPQVEVVYKVFKAKQEAKAKLKKEKVQKIKRRKIGTVLSVMPDTQPDVKKLIYANIREAQKVAVPAIIKARQVSYEAALQEVVQIVAKKHEGQVRVKAIPQVKIEVKPMLETITQTMPAAQTLSKSEQKKKPEPNALKAQSAKGKGLEFYFQKDKLANKNRIEVVLANVSKLLKDKKEKKDIIGKDVAGMIKDEGHLRSEVVRTGHMDGSLHGFRAEVARIGKIEKLRNLKGILVNIAEKNTGIKLTLRKPQNSSATRKDAQDVYKASLNGKEGYFQEYGATIGDFKEHNQKLFFVPNSVLRPAPVA